MKIFKYDIKFNTFLKKGVKKLNDDFFVGMICGYQGTGKNWYGVMLLLEQPNKPYLRHPSTKQGLEYTLEI